MVKLSLNKNILKSNDYLYLSIALTILSLIVSWAVELFVRALLSV